MVNSSSFYVHVSQIAVRQLARTTDLLELIILHLRRAILLPSCGTFQSHPISLKTKITGDIKSERDVQAVGVTKIVRYE